MNPMSAAVTSAAVLLWLGMVLAISFLEAPLKFRAPGVTIPIGLGIGRLVFRALNLTECLLGAVAVVAVATGRPSAAVVWLTAVAAVVLAVQIGAVRPALNRRSDLVLAGKEPVDAPRSRVHFVYVGLELAKVVALALLAVTVLAALVP